METDLKSDLIAVLELNESWLPEPNHANFSVACEIRARLLQALNKANTFFESNLELLATIAQLKRDLAHHHAATIQNEEILNGRIFCLKDIVQKQQNDLEAQSRIIRLKGIWGNLLKITNLPSTSFDDECSVVTTWLSLQCAHDATRPINALSEEAKYGRPSIGINQFLETMRTLYHQSEERIQQYSKENSELRVLLNENSAKRYNLTRQLSDCSQAIQRLEMENEDWYSRARELTARNNFLDLQIQQHSQAIESIEKDLAAQKINVSIWRDKCHEILDAVDIATAASKSPFQALAAPTSSHQRESEKNRFSVRNRSLPSKQTQPKSAQPQRSNIHTKLNPPPKTLSELPPENIDKSSSKLGGSKTSHPRELNQNRLSSSGSQQSSRSKSQPIVIEPRIDFSNTFYDEEVVDVNEMDEYSDRMISSTSISATPLTFHSPYKFEEEYFPVPVSEYHPEKMISKTEKKQEKQERQPEKQERIESSPPQIDLLDKFEDLELDLTEELKGKDLEARLEERGRSTKRNPSRYQTTHRSSSESSSSPHPAPLSHLPIKSNYHSNPLKVSLFHDQHKLETNKTIEQKKDSYSSSPVKTAPSKRYHSPPPKRAVQSHQHKVLLESPDRRYNHEEKRLSKPSYYHSSSPSPVTRRKVSEKPSSSPSPLSLLSPSTPPIKSTPKKWNPYFSQTKDQTPKSPSVYDLARQIVTQSSSHQPVGHSRRPISPIYKENQQVIHSQIHLLRASYESNGTLGSELMTVPGEYAYDLEQDISGPAPAHQTNTTTNSNNPLKLHEPIVNHNETILSFNDTEEIVDIF